MGHPLRSPKPAGPLRGSRPGLSVDPPRAALTAVILLLVLLGLSARVAPTTYHVALTGSDANPGTAGAPFRTIQHAVDAARAGDAISIHAGGYPERVRIRRSGTSSQPIVLASAGDGTVTVDPGFAPVDPACDKSSPERDRAIEITNGADNWTIRGLTIVGGVLVTGDFPPDFQDDAVLDRSLPGRGQYDPAGAETTLPTLGVDPADGIQILNDTIRRRGIYVIGGRFGVIAGNDAGQTVCGVGAVILLSRFSDFWNVHDNLVHDTPAHFHHFMSEGIRISNASMYNTISANTVQDMGGLGRGITTDVNAGWNLFQENVSRRALHGYNEQTGGWGNQWIANRAESNRASGYAFDLKDDFFLWPDDGVPRFTQARCNVSVSNPLDVNIGLIRDASFSGQSFTKVQLGTSGRALWSVLANTWEGAPEAPTPNPPAGPCS